MTLLVGGNEQLVLISGCKFAGCGEPVVGHSITDEGSVCKHHNEQEWGEALTTKRGRRRDDRDGRFYRALGLQLIEDARVGLSGGACSEEQAPSTELLPDAESTDGQR